MDTGGGTEAPRSASNEAVAKSFFGVREIVRK
jgi:hypothetical protein